MSQHLSVNGKVYLPSNELAATFGYSSDYLGKLARDEKILGTLIGRQWFIEPESLKTFLLKTEIQKKIRKEELSIQRKAEHLAHQKELVQKIEATSQSSMAFAQAAVIVFCGLLVGTLGWAGAEQGLQPGDLAMGAKESAALIAEAVLPSFYADENFSHTRMLAASTEGLVPQVRVGEAENLVFTTLPQFPPREAFEDAGVLDTVAGEPASSTASRVFSDEVRIVFDEEGKELIQPVFKNERVGQEQFLIVPVKASEN
jgi:hypothetical protein